MIKYCLRSFVLVFLVYGCSSSSSSSDDDNSSVISTDVTIIGSLNGIVYQADINNGESTTVYNLTQELGLPDSNIRFYGRDYSPMIYFYHGPSLSQVNKAWEKSLINGSHTAFNIPCNPMENRVSGGPVTYGDNVFWLRTTFDGIGTAISLEVFNKLSNECHSINLGTTISSTQLNAFTYHDGKLLVSYTNESRNTVLSKVNSSNYSIENQVIIEGLCGITLNEDKIYCFLNNSDRQYIEYSFNTFQLIRSSNFTSASPYFFGIEETNFEGDNMLMLQQAAQPSPVAWIPVIYDLNNGSTVKQVDSFLIFRNLQLVEGLEGAQISNIKFGVDLKNEVVVGVYEDNVNSIEKTFGVFFSDFESNIIKTIELDFQPGDIIIN